MAEKESEHKQIVDTMKAREVELINKVEDLAQQLEVNSQELEKQNRYQLEYRKLLNEMFFEKKRNSTMSQTSVDSYRSASAIITGTSKTELTSDYGDHDTLDKELAQADSDDEEEPDHTLLVAELKAMLKDDARLSIVDTAEHSRVVKDLRQELEDVRSAYEEDTSELQKTLMEVKTQLLSFSRQRSLSESSGSDTTQDKAESALAKIKNLQRQIAQQREDHNEVIQLLETAQTLASDRERKVNELSASLEALRTDYSHQSSQVETLNTEITQLKSQITETQQQLEVAQQAAQEFEKKAGENAKMLESITAERDARVRDASESTSEIRQAWQTT